MDKKNIFERKTGGKKTTYYIVMTVCVLAIAAISFISYKSVQNSLSNKKIENAVDNVDKVDTNVENINDTNKQETLIEEPVDNQETEPSEQMSAPAAKVETKPYIMPVKDAEIKVKFSLTVPVYSQTLKDWRIHDGIDISAKLGDNVLAVNDGAVESIENDDLYGITVVIKHTDGKKSTYCNLADDVELEQGQIINQGDIVGKIGQTAVFEISEGPHLHFEMSENGKKIDPLSIIKEVQG